MCVYSLCAALQWTVIHIVDCCLAHTWPVFTVTKHKLVRTHRKKKTEKKMDTKFQHSVKVPTQYKKAAKVLKNSMEQRASLKTLIFSEKHAVNSPISIYHPHRHRSLAHTNTQTHAICMVYVYFPLWFVPRIDRVNQNKRHCQKLRRCRYLPTTHICVSDKQTAPGKRGGGESELIRQILVVCSFDMPLQFPTFLYFHMFL